MARRLMPGVVTAVAMFHTIGCSLSKNALAGLPLKTYAYPLRDLIAFMQRISWKTGKALFLRIDHDLGIIGAIDPALSAAPSLPFALAKGTPACITAAACCCHLAYRTGFILIKKVCC